MTEEMEGPLSGAALRLHSLMVPVVSALGGAAVGLTVQGVPGAFLGAAVPPALQFIADADRKGGERAQRTVDEAARRSGMTPEALAAWAAEDDRHLGLLVVVVEGAWRAREERRVGVLARVLAEGARDDARVDALTLIAETWGVLGPAHVQVLKVMGHPPVGSDPRHPSWAASDLSSALPHLAEVAFVLLSALAGRGCIELDQAPRFGGGPSLYFRTDFGHACLSYLEDRAPGPS